MLPPVKVAVNDTSAAAANTAAGTGTGTGTGSTCDPIATEDLSVSGIINSVRKSRGASQQQLPPLPPAQDTESKSQDIRTAGEDSDDHVPYCLFDTHSMVNRLVEDGYSRDQATSVMALTKIKVYEAMERLKGNMLTKSDLENDAYLFRAALQELRTETQMIRRNDQSILESQAAAISRDIESLAQRLTDEIDNLRSDIQIELNNHKHDSSHEMKSLDMELHSLASKYQVVMGEMKTDIEAIKLESIRKGLMAAVVTTAVLLAIIWMPELLDRLNLRRTGKAQQTDRGVRQSNDYGVGDGARTSSDQAVSDAAATGPAPTAPPGAAGSRAPQRQPLLSIDDSGRAGAGRQGLGEPGPRFRDHSHLHIQYDPTISAAESQFGSAQQRPAGGASGDDAGGYDDWFDAFFYSPQDIDRRRGRARESASLVDSDPTFDAAYWRAPSRADRAEASGGDAPTAAGQASESDQQSDTTESPPPPTIPLNFSPSDGATRGDGNRHG